MTLEAKARWKRRVRTLAWVVLIWVGLPTATHYFLRWSTEWELRRAVAEADRLDPGWGLQDLENSRKVIADAENSALKILAIKKGMPERADQSAANRRRMPGGRRMARDLDVEVGPVMPPIRALSPQFQLSPEMIEWLRGDLRNRSAAIADARSLVDFPRGRYPIEYAHRLWETVLVSEESQVTADLLWEDAIMAAEEQQIDQALSSAIAVLNAGRSIGDEPTLDSQSHRLAIQRLALLTIERVLAQGQVSSSRLETLQHLLEDEAAEPLLLQTFRAERAGTYVHMTHIFSGEWKYRMQFFHGRIANKLPLNWHRYIDTVIVRHSYPAYFRLLTALVEIAKLPTDDQLEQVERLIGQARQLPIEFQSWFESVARWAHGFHRNQAWLRCAVAALASERFRLAHGSWPDSISGLVPEFLSETPIDPFDGQPLRLRHLKDSLVIYSIGPDGNDDGGLVSRADFHSAGSDVGFQLWDVSSRRQPPPPPAKPVFEAEAEATP